MIKVTTVGGDKNGESLPQKLVRLIGKDGKSVSSPSPSSSSPGESASEEVLFNKFRELYTHLGGKLEKIEEVYLVDNPRHRRSFEEYRRNITEKHQDNEGLFRKEDWRGGNDVNNVELRRQYLLHLAGIITKFRSQLNDGSKVILFHLLSLSRSLFSSLHSFSFVMLFF